MQVSEKIKQIMDIYTKMVKDILVENKKRLRLELEKVIWDGSLEKTIPDFIEFRGTMDIIEKFINVYILASEGVDVETGAAEKRHRQVKSYLGIDTLKEWSEIRKDIGSKMGWMSDEDLVRYLIERYGVIGTGEIVSRKPESDEGLVNEVKWTFYLAAVVLNRVIKSEAKTLT